MSSRDDLNVWASIIDIDSVTNVAQRTEIVPDLWNYGWLREVPVTAQTLNQLMYLITDVVKNDTLSVANNLSEVDASAARTNLDLLQRSQNFADVADASACRDNLGLNTDTLFNTFFDKVYPVGSIYENKTNGTNPATLLGRGTWVADGEGRVAIGAGSTSDDNAESINFTAGSTGGEYNHTLTESEMPSHVHEQQAHLSGGGVVRSYQLDDDNNAGIESGNVDTVATGGDGSHNNIQPYIVYYRWLRTA